MRHRVFLEPQAKTDIISILDWYRGQSPGLDEKFMSEMNECVELLKQNPFLFQIRFLALRAVVLQRFPYLIYYLITKKEVHIIAVLAAAQDQHKILKHR